MVLSDASCLEQHGACFAHVIEQLVCTSTLLSNNACVSHTCTRSQEAGSSRIVQAEELVQLKAIECKACAGKQQQGQLKVQ